MHPLLFRLHRQFSEDYIHIEIRIHGALHRYCHSFVVCVRVCLLLFKNRFSIPPLLSPESTFTDKRGMVCRVLLLSFSCKQEFHLFNGIKWETVAMTNSNTHLHHHLIYPVSLHFLIVMLVIQSESNLAH